MSESQENIRMDVSETQTTNTQPQQTQPQAQPQQSEPSITLTEIEVTNENVALNLLVSFLNLAQRRGVFNMQESAKIWECVSKFQR